MLQATAAAVARRTRRPRRRARCQARNRERAPTASSGCRRSTRWNASRREIRARTPPGRGLRHAAPVRTGTDRRRASPRAAAARASTWSCRWRARAPRLSRAAAPLRTLQDGRPRTPSAALRQERPESGAPAGSPADRPAGSRRALRHRQLQEERTVPPPPAQSGRASCRLQPTRRRQIDAVHPELREKARP